MRLLIPALIMIFLMVTHPANAEGENSPHFQTAAGVTNNITTPTEGDVVQGSVIIQGNTISEGFLSFEVDFTQSKSNSNTWVLLQESSQPVQDGVLAVWDTTTITDGDYSLRLQVVKQDGTTSDVILPGLRVRNYTAIETSTPSAALSANTLSTLFPSAVTKPQVTSAVGTVTSTITPLSTNPAELSNNEVFISIGKGAIISLGIFMILGLYIGMHALMNRLK